MGAGLDVPYWRWLALVFLLPAFVNAMLALTRIGSSFNDRLVKDSDRQRQMAQLLRAGAWFQYAVAFSLIWVDDSTAQAGNAVALVGMGLYLQISSWFKHSTRTSRLLGRVLLSSARRRV